MNIIVVSGAYAPVLSPRAFRTTELVKEFCRTGHKVTIYLPKSEQSYSVDDGIETRFFEVCKKERLMYGNSFLARVINRIAIQFFSYPDFTMMKELKRLLKNEKNEYDLLLTIVAPHAINWTVGQMYRKGHRIAKTWVADCGDPFMLEGNWHIYRPIWFKIWEKTWCNYCEYISVPHKGAINGYYPEFRDKIRIIPQAMNFDEVEIDEYKPNDVPTFVYSGSVVKGVCDPRNLLRYLEKKDIPFKFYIYTQQPELFSEFTKSLCDRLIVRPYKPRLELIKDLSRMDFLVNFKLNNTVQASSKIIDYSLAKRPILYITYENMDTLLVDKFLSGDYSGRYEVKNVEQFDIKNIAKLFLELCK